MVRTLRGPQTTPGFQMGCMLVNKACPETTWLPPTNTIWLQLMADGIPGLKDAGSVGVASRLAPGCSEPLAIWVAMSLRRDRASCMAPPTLSKPAPCWNRFAPGRGSAEYCSIAFIRGGVRPGLASSIRATAPATAGAATEVPLRRIRPSLTKRIASGWAREGVSCRSLAGAPLGCAAAAPSTLLPMATRSGFRRLSRTNPAAVRPTPRVGPREEKKLTVSSTRATVPFQLTEPTVITDGSMPGEPMLP